MKTEEEDFFTKIILHLQFKHKLNFFISPKDYDVICRWWDKRIPIQVITASIDHVISRRDEKQKKVSGFSSFYYEVKKSFQAFLQLNVGNENRDTQPPEMQTEPETTPLEHFLDHFPDPLLSLKDDFHTLNGQLKNAIDDAPPAIANTLIQKLVDLFREDPEITLRTEIFLKNLAPSLRNPEIENRYRFNYLKNKFHIPDF
ncbi:MAG: hypothetical protein ACM3SY_16015 [Candidatus Omnitrophota bacterium]